MDHKDGLCASSWENSSTMNELASDVPSDHPSFSNFSPQRPQQKWEDPSILDFGIEPSFKKFKQPSETQSSLYHNHNNQTKVLDQDVQMIQTLQTGKFQDWDPNTMLNSLSFLEQKIHQLQDLVHLIVGRRGQVLGRPDEVVTQQQQLITADLTSIIAQLITTAGSLLPSSKQTLSTATPSIGQPGHLNGVNFPSGACLSSGVQPKDGGRKFSEQSNHTDLTAKCGSEQNYNTEDHESKDEEDADESENLLPGTYEILQLEKEEILAPHTHFCTICGKGFKRDANLRMHMRGHGDEYKTPAALAKPHKEANSEPALIKRYSCPYAGCKRNKDHKKFQPLKTILCVKNHYKRTHCDKSHTCSRCHTKKFSVIADLKTHEKHCGRDKWLCSCGTTFSRKDKLFGHITLFQGHTPAISVEEMKASCVSADQGMGTDATNKVGLNFSSGSSAYDGNAFQNVMEMKGGVDDPTAYFSPMNYDTCNFGGFHEFPRPPFEDTESSFSFLLSGSCSYNQRSGGESSSNNLEQC